MPSPRLKPAHALALLGMAFVWGSNFVVIKIGLRSFDPMPLAVIRFAAAAFPLVFFMPRPTVALRWVALNGLLAGAGQFGLLFLALKADIAPGLASLLMQTQVFVTIAGASALFGEPVGALRRVGLALGALGLATVGWHLDASSTATGLMLVLCAAGCWAASNLLVRRLARRRAQDGAPPLDMLGFVAWSSLFAIGPLLVAAWLDTGWTAAWRQSAAAGVAGWAAALWQGIGNTLLGFAIWNACLARYPASIVVPWALLVPVFGMSCSALWLGEPLPGWKLAAGAMVLLGVALATRPDT